MKRVLIFLLVLFAIAGTCFAAWRGQERAEQTKASHIPQEVPLRLDAATADILAHSTKVETFRLADFHEGEIRSDAERTIEEKQSLGTIDDHTILRVGSPQDAAFAGALSSALQQTRVYKGGTFAPELGCFDPGVAFRVWKNAAHIDVCICFYCSGADIVTKDSMRHIAWQAHPDLGPSRAALLALSVQAFPDDTRLLALKNGRRLPDVVN